MPRPEIILTPELLRTFVTLVEQCNGSVTQTAETLGINEASVSKRIKPLHTGRGERAGRLLWLRKEGKTFRLTAEGAAVLPLAVDQLRRWGLFTTLATTERLPVVTFACGQDAVTGFVREAVRLFRAAHAQVALQLATGIRGRDRITRVAGGELDLAVVTHEPAVIERYARGQPLHVEDLFPDPLVLVCAARSKSARDFEALPASGVRAEELPPFPFVLPDADAGIRQEFERLLEKAGVSRLPQVVCEVGGWGAILAFVSDGVGVGLLPRSVVARSPAKLLTRPLHPSIAPANCVRLIARLRRSDTTPDLSEAGMQFLGALQEATKPLREA
jgi:DNA-binding transcriptional LysR family regulator